MLVVNNLQLTLGGKTLFRNESLRVLPGDRIGLTGRNGSGKTTLLRILSGRIKPDNGTVNTPGEYRIGFLKQSIPVIPDHTVMEEALTAFREVQETEQRIQRLQQELESLREDKPELQKKVTELAALQDRLHFLEGDMIQQKVETVLKGLGFEPEGFGQNLRTLSGGWQMRAILARILLQKPDLLLLDEPTNHLDIYSIQWLENFLSDYPGSIVLVSHDRRFLDKVTNRTMEIANGSLKSFKGNFSAWEAFKMQEEEKLVQQKKQQDKFIRHTETLINKFRAKKNKAAFAQSLIRKLERLERIELPETDRATLQIRFPEIPRSARVVAKAAGVSKKYGSKTVLDKVDFELLRGETVAFVGKNGEGKSTFAKILAGEEGYEGLLETGNKVQMALYSQDAPDRLPAGLSILDVMLRSGSSLPENAIRSMLGAFLFRGDDVYKKIGVLSGGEKARLALAQILLQPNNFLILDEPTNHLDIISQDVLKSALLQYSGTLIIISHDRDFLDGLVEKVYEFKNRKIICYAGDMKYFLYKNPVFGQAASLSSGASHRQTNTPSANKQQYQLRKDLRRQERSLQNQVRKCEMEIERLSGQLQDIERQLASGRPSPAETYERYDQLRAELTHWEDQWAEQAEALESVRKSLDEMEK